MFEATHRSLTRYYISVTVALFTFVVIAFLSVMTWTIYQHEKFEAVAFAKEEGEEYLAFFEKSILMDSRLKMIAVPDEKVSIDEIHNALRMFSVVRKPDGETFPLTFLTERMERWMLEQVEKHDLSSPNLMTYTINQEKRKVFLVKEDIFQDGKFYGTIYAGKDVTIIWTVAKRMFYFSLLLVVFFTFFLYRFGKKAATRAMRPVEASMLRQKQFISDASHELKTPLSVLLTGTQVLKSDKENKLSEFSETIIDDLQDEIKKMSSLVENLLQLSKLDEQKKSSKQKEDVAKIACLAVNKFSPLARQKSIQLLLEDSQPIYKEINSENFTQILSILLDNAIKYTLDNGTIKVRLAVQNKKLVLTVEDNGIGISADDQKYVFDRFYRADKARSRVDDTGSAGLGLAIIKTLVEKENGTIKLQSILGQGSTFTVELP